MLLVIFGAGASYDSLSRLPAGAPHHHSDSRPPLADHLFQDRGFFRVAMQRHHQMLPIVPLLQNRPEGISLEQRLEQLESESGSHRRYQQLAAIRFYIHDIIDDCTIRWLSESYGMSNYSTLLDEIENRFRNPVLLVTFNYDTLIEKSLESVGLSIKSIDDYIAHPKYKLFKVHGSANWIHPVLSNLESLANTTSRSDQSLVQEIITRAGELRISKEFCVWDRHPLGSYSPEPPGHLQGAIPAIAIPVMSKLNYECPEPHVKLLEESLPQVTKVLIIGWRAAEKYFSSKLASSLPKGVPCLIVSGTEDGAIEVRKNLESANVNAEITSVGGGFTDFTINQTVRSLLST